MTQTQVQQPLVFTLPSWIKIEGFNFEQIKDLVQSLDTDTSGIMTIAFKSGGNLENEMIQMTIRSKNFEFVPIRPPREVIVPLEFCKTNL